MYETVNSVSRTDWSDAPAFIIGGGPSLKPFADRLSELSQIGYVVAANDSYLHCSPDYIVSIDRTWLKNRWHDIPKMPAKVGYGYNDGMMREQCDNLDYLRMQQGDGLPEMTGPFVNGLCSGHFAMQYAYRMKTKTIYLLGIDMKHAGQHYHDGYAWGQSASTYRLFPRWAQRFDECAADFKKAGVQVFNCSPDSALVAYPYKPLEEILT